MLICKFRGDKGLFRAANILQIADIVRRVLLNLAQFFLLFLIKFLKRYLFCGFIASNY